MSVFPDNGIISLSRLCQSAKQRLRRIKAGEEPASLLRLHQMNPRAELNLAAVQWLIATEMGFDSWPALKAHTDAIRFAAQHPELPHLNGALSRMLRGEKTGLTARQMCAGSVESVSRHSNRTGAPVKI